MNQLSFPEVYEQSLVGPLFRPFAEMVLAEVALRPGERALDIACGTGIVARLAKAQTGAAGQVAGVDASANMLEVARKVAPEIDWREGNAGALPLREGEQFDAVVCHQGFQFFPDKAAAAREMRRALAPNGRLAVATWRSLEEIPFARELHKVAERHVGAISDQRHSFGEAAPLEAILREAGMHAIQSRTVSRTVRFADGSVFLRLNTMALVGMSAAAKGMTDAERNRAVEEIVNDSGSVVSASSDASGLAFNLSSNVTTARG
jgi:ubiquinone/menaquinone biosynthesis C-methylase UbiE